MVERIRKSGGSRNKVEFNDLLYLGHATDEEREEWELFKKGQTVKSKRELRKDYVKILENKRKEAEKYPVGPCQIGRKRHWDRKGDSCTHFL